MLLVLLAGCVAYTTQTLRDVAPGGAAGEFYVIVSEQDCVSGAAGPVCQDTSTKILRCTDTAAGTDCYTTLTSKEAFDAAAGRRPVAARTSRAMSCGTLMAMVSADWSEAMILEKVNAATAVSADEVECMTSAGVSAEVQAAIRAKAAVK